MLSLFLHYVDMVESCYEAYSPWFFRGRIRESRDDHSALAEAFALSAAIVPLHQESWHLDRILRPHVGVPLLKQGPLL
jgi:hypothetical protein